MGLFTRFIAKVRGSSHAQSIQWSEIEAELLGADLGPVLVAQILEESKNFRGEDAESAVLKLLKGKLSNKSRTLASGGGTSVILVVGVNGTGKTTSVAKLAQLLKRDGKSVTLCAADTFRAAAVDQLKTWGGRIEAEVISGKEGAEPASVAFDAAQKSYAAGVEFLLVDTAGRLHNKSDLMAELGKVRRVIEKVTAVSEVLLVIDGTTGQNGMAQAKIFSEAVDVTGLIVTKLDGSARGGVALAIENQLDIPIKFIGTGEGVDDFLPFDPDSYLASLVS